MQLVVSSFQRAKAAGFVPRFYVRLFEADPGVRHRFRRTDLPQQYELLVHGIHSVIDFANGGVVGKMALERLRRSHGPERLDIPPAMFGVWLRTFLETLAELDPAYDAVLEKAWKEVLVPAIQVLTSGRFQPEESDDPAAVVRML